MPQLGVTDLEPSQTHATKAGVACHSIYTLSADGDPMEPFEPGRNETVCMSNSPRRSPHITQGMKSPVRSLHPELAQSHSTLNEKDTGMRTLDFFDDSSGDEENSPADPAETAPDLERRGPATKKRQSNTIVPPMTSLAAQCESKTVKLSPTQDGYQPLSPTVWADAPDQVGDRADTPSTSFSGSVDELLPSNLHSSPPQFRSSRISSGRTPRSSAHIQRSDDRQSSLQTTRPSTALGAYAIAHEITLQALMRDEETLDRNLQGIPLAPIQSSDRRSLLPAALSFKDDPRSPKVRDFSSPQSVTSKKVQVVPPPIDVSEAGQRSLPADLIRTPYPFSPDHHIHRKDFGQNPRSPPTPPPPASTSESILTLSIRPTTPSRAPRVTSIAIPAANDFAAVRHSGLWQKEQHFQALDFDDAALFLRIRAAYASLAGRRRFFSARSLSRVVVVVPKNSSRDGGCRHAPRSPHVLAANGLDDTFGEEELLRLFHRPAAGKGQCAFVHWAHRLAAAPAAAAATSPRTENSDGGEGGLVRRADQVEGLEFVLAWSARRIVAVLALMLALSVAAALLWTLLGTNSVVGDDSQADIRGAGYRVAGGVLMGICVLLLGLSGMGGWLGVSWLLM